MSLTGIIIPGVISYSYMSGNSVSGCMAEIVYHSFSDDMVSDCILYIDKLKLLFDINSPRNGFFADLVIAG